MTDQIGLYKFKLTQKRYKDGAFYLSVIMDGELTKAARSTWARLIKKVYEVDPLICPHCGGQMRFLVVSCG